MKEITDKMDFIKSKLLYSAEDDVKGMRKQAMKTIQYLQKAHLIRTIIQNIQKTLKIQQ